MIHRAPDLNAGGDLVREARGVEVLSALLPYVTAAGTRATSLGHLRSGAGIALSCREIRGGRAGILLRALSSDTIEILTSEVPFDLGIAASRVTWIAGRAAQAAAEALQERLRVETAAQCLR